MIGGPGVTLAELIPSLRTTCYARLERGVWPGSAVASCAGGLAVGGVELAELARTFGTPLYVLDTGQVAARMQAYRTALPGAEIVYAGKALLTRAVVKQVAAAGLALDVCSGGELALALSAGFPPDRIVVHGNVKTDAELRVALDVGVGRIVLDSVDDIDRLGELARHDQRVLVRITPDVDGHTHPALATGVEDQKFGVPIDQVETARRVGAYPHLRLVGLHCHIGSQVSDVGAYELAAARMVEAMATLRRHGGPVLDELDLGGGHAVPYREGDPRFDLAAFAQRVPAAVAAACARHDLPVPRLLVEPGRAIVATAGVTLYRVASVKRLRGGRVFVAVDGGMSDNPRPALYGARYTARLVGRPCAAALEPMTVVGRHCEAGDRIAVDVPLPGDVHAGDLLAVPCTGAYHHAMASNYTLVPRPALVGVDAGVATPLVRRETLADLLARDLG